MHAHSNIDSDSSPNYYAKSITASIGAVSENLIFHPLDTIKTRFQQHPERISFFTPKFKEIKHVVLPHVTSYHGGIASLYQGLLSGIAYRITQRNIMFVGQQWTDSLLKKHAGPTIKHYLGQTYYGPITAALAGVISSLAETPFLLLDTVKIRMQSQKISFPQAMAAGHLFDAAGITILRNVIAATALFGGAAYVRQLYGLKNPREASLTQEWTAASFGAFLATSFNNWADVLKTRRQNSHVKTTSWQIARTVLATKGIPGLLFAGLIPRIFTIAPRTALSLTFYNKVGPLIEKALSQQGFFSKKKPLTFDASHHNKNVREDKKRPGPK